ncbi:MAG: GAF domain-containing sensor histidine kinase [Salinibacter sp.]
MSPPMLGRPDTDSEAERDRLRALRRFQILDTPPEPEFDRVAELAAHLFDVPVALVTFVDTHRQWHKAALGTDRAEIPRRCSLCAATVETEGTSVIEDLSESDWFAENPFVAGPPHARFYAGTPLVTPDGYPIGTVSVLGPEPRSAAPALVRQLEHLSDIAMETLLERQYALGDRDELSQTVLDHLPGLFYVLNREGRLRRWNARFERVSAYDPEELAGRSAEAFFEGSDRRRVTEAISEVFREGSATVEADFVRRNGSTVPTLFTGVRTYLEGAFHLVGMGIDISEQRRQARALRAAKEEAEEASRVKSKMLKNLSHEIRTPLTSILGFARVLKENLSGEDGRAARLVHEAGRRLKGTVDSVLQLSKLETGTQTLNREQLDLCTVVETGAELLRPRAEDKQQRLRIDVPDAPVEGRWNEGALRRIVENLLENAIKFTPEGGTIALRVEEDEGRAVLKVEDTGVGISEEALPHIFDAFKQESEGLTREYEGSGLGLANVKELTELMGGTIEVDSTKGEGSCFTVRLPLVEPPA